MALDLSEFLPKKGKTLDEFLPKVQAPPQDEIGPAESVRLFWKEETCSCSAVYPSQDSGAMIVHTMYRRQGFSRKSLGRVMIPCTPGLDCSDLPVTIETKRIRIYCCPACVGNRPSMPLFTTEKPAFIVSPNGDCGSPHLMAWRSMASTAKLGEYEQRLQDMKKRDVNIDDLLLFRTTELDLRNATAGQVLCDAESNIETN